MSNLSKYFTESAPEDVHPRVKSWRRLIQEEGKTARCELARRLTGPMYSPARLYVSFYDETGAEVRVDEVEWDPELNLELMHLHVQATSPENEGKRLGMMLKTWFARPEDRYGDGFFSAVLYDYLRGSALAGQGPVQGALQEVYEIAPSKEGSAYADCVEAIEGVIIRAAHALTDALRYDQAPAEGILASAIAYYLDDRFSISQRRMLGFR